MEKIRIYGPFGENDSWSRVAAGMHSGLVENEVSAGVFDLKSALMDDDDGLSEGYDAEIGVYVGPPKHLSVMKSRGRHKERWAMIAPNSSWVPPEIMDQAQRHCTGLLAPSTWGCNVLRAQGYGIPVHLWQHGVSDAFRPDVWQRPDLHEWRVIHFASTGMDRKGTARLIEAWSEFLFRNSIANAKLTIVLSAPHGYAEDIVACCEARKAGAPGLLRQSLEILPRLNLGEAQMAEMLTKYNLVIQPSRAEGFGLVPLEALACGVPVAATLCTGHGEHMYIGQPGVVPIPHREDKLSDDGPGAMAPEVLAEDIAWALGEAYRAEDVGANTRYDAVHNSERVREYWGWTEVTARFLSRMGL